MLYLLNEVLRQENSCSLSMPKISARVGEFRNFLVLDLEKQCVQVQGITTESGLKAKKKQRF